MTRRKVRLGHRYRCIYTWRMRQRLPRTCPRCKSRLWNEPKLEPVVLEHGLGTEEILSPHRAAILRLARRYGAMRVRVFGSVRRRGADAKSDVDLLVDWKSNVDLLDTAAFRRRVAELLGRKVQTVEVDHLHWAIRPQILSEAIPL